MTRRTWIPLAAKAIGAVALAATVVLTASCTHAPDSQGAGSEPSMPADLASVGPGTLLAPAESLQPLDLRVGRAGAWAQRITYRSTSGTDGSATAVTGSVFTPQSPPPAGGWPVVVFAHSTVGILEDCAPSRHADLLGMVSQVVTLLQEGYLVVLPDYQGLGSKGPHPYLEPRTAAYNVIDAVRAARALTPTAGTRWAAYGASQGGQASWAAAELAPTYGAGLDMVGAAALAPIVDLASLPQTAFDMRLSKDQLPVLQFILNAVTSVDPSFHLDDYLKDFALDNNAKLLQCSGAGVTDRNRLVLDLGPEDVAPRDQAAVDAMTAYLRGWSLPLSETSPVPVFAVVGSADDIAFPGAVEEAARQACARGDVVVLSIRDREGHDNLDFRPALTWLNGRFGDVPVEGACNFPGR